MEPQFLSTENLQHLYNSVKLSILTKKDIDIDSNSQFKGLIPKLATQVYEKKKGLSLEELNKIGLNTVTIFFTNIIDKKLKKQEEYTESFQDYGDSTSFKNSDDDDFGILYKAVDLYKDVNNNETQFNPNNPNNKQKKRLDPFIVVLDVHPSNNSNTPNEHIGGREYKDIPCKLINTIKLTTKCDIYLEFLVLNELKRTGDTEGAAENIEQFHTFVLEIKELKGQKVISNNSSFDGNIIIPNDTYGYNDNATGETIGDEGGADGITQSGCPPGPKKYTSQTIKLKSNFISTESPDSFSTFTVSLKGLFSGINTSDIPTTEYLSAATNTSRVQVGLLFKPINE